MVIDLPKEMKTKVAYLELLLENPDGITPSDVAEIYFDDVTIHAANNALRRLKKQGCAVRERDGEEYRYYITDRGIMKYNYLVKKEGSKGAFGYG